MEQWKQHIVAGNQCCAQNQLYEAGGHYRKAKERAEKLFAHWPDPDQAVWAMVVSYHNLADLYVRKEQPSLALDAAQNVHHIMLAVLECPDSNSKRKAALMKGSRCTYTVLLDLARKLNAEYEDFPVRFEITTSNQDDKGNRT